MKRSTLLFISGALFVVAVVGCQAIGGIQTRTTDPLLTGCSLPSTGNGRVRLVNVAAVAGNTDFCIRASGTSWGRPVFRDGGNDALCLGTPSQPGGLAYTQATVPFAVPAGKIDVKAIPAGQTCALAGTSELDGITVGDSTKASPVVTLMRYGGGSSKEAITALPEAIRSTIPSDKTAVRVVNGLSAGKSIEWGFSSSKTLPATINTVLGGSAIAPGAVTPTSSSTTVATINSSGYAEFLPQTFNLAAFYATDNANNAVTLYPLPTNVDLATFYVFGDPNDVHNLHPVTGMYCEDALSLGASQTYDAGLSDAGTVLTPTDTKLLAQCTLAPLSLVSVDLVNVSLYGANAPFEATRASFIYSSIAARTSDLVCILEADSLNDRTQIATASKAPNAQGTAGQYQYSYTVTTDVSTPPSNPLDVHMNPATAPCGGSVSAASVNKVYTCVEQNCSTTTGGDPNGTGTLNGTTQCLSSDCTLAFAGLYDPITASSTAGQLADDSCFDCIIYHLTDEETLATGQTSCTTSSAAPYAFQGQTPTMILSHYPIVSTASYNLPATGYRRAVLKAQVQLENKTIDFFCGQLTSPLIDSSLPYRGYYGSDVADGGGVGNGWEDEQFQQAQEGLAWIQQQIAADKLPAIVAMDLHSDDGASTSEDGGLEVVSPEVVDLFNATTSNLAAAVPAGAVPMCDYCPAPTNPYNAGTPPFEFMHSYLSGFPENATQTETLWGTDNSQIQIPTDLPNQPAPPGGTGPLLEYYAHNYTILRP